MVAARGETSKRLPGRSMSLRLENAKGGAEANRECASGAILDVEALV